MNYTLRIAVRYIVSKRSMHFISVISMISMIGIVIGVAAVIIVLSIFNGFREFTENQIVGFDPHLRITSTSGVQLTYSKNVFSSLDNFDFIDSAIPMIQGRVIGIKENKMQVINLQSLKPRDFEKIYKFREYLVMGSLILTKFNDLNTILLSTGIADKMDVVPGDTISLITPYRIEKAIKSFSMPSPRKLIVSGIFQTNMKEFDETIAIVDLETGKDLFKFKSNIVTSIDVRMIDIDNIDKYKINIQNSLGDNYKVDSWRDLHKQLYKIMDFERNLAFVVLSLIILIAVFNVLASLTMTVTEKKKDIGILSSVGASQKDIRNIFLLQGTIIGIFSTVFGVVLGVLFCLGQAEFGWFKLDGANFLISAIPIQLQFVDVVVVSIFSLILSLSSTIYPSYKASKMVIVDSLRNE